MFARLTPEDRYRRGAIFYGGYSRGAESREVIKVNRRWCTCTFSMVNRGVGNRHTHGGVSVAFGIRGFGIRRQRG